MEEWSEKVHIRRKQGWQSLYRVTGIVAILLLLFIGKIGYKFSLAYQTDAASLKNHFTPGHNTTYFEESFPEQSMIPGESKTIMKKVRICNEKDGQNVACYIRAKVLYSTEDLGTYTLRGTDSKWVLGKDGYYYYTKAVHPGEITGYLMTEVLIDGQTADLNSGNKEECLKIYIYEESCQIKDPDTQKSRSWQEAWEHALSRKVQ